MESSGQQIENDLFWRGYGRGWESKSLSLWRDLARRSRFVADVGANTGVFALAAQAINPDAKVVAVEPSARVADRLRRNIDLNGYPIRIEPIAASDATGMATFYDFAAEHQYSASLEPWMDGTTSTQVPVDTLDNILERNGFERLDLLKVDVERHEPNVLRGATRYLKYKPTILIEVLDDEIGSAIRQILPGYRMERLCDERNWFLTPTE
jgi:FkbM family methyltransferase